tara:strand:+ start:55 stop:195 length:141 start_codon:yes stop_codon:yes gene_type:complete
LGFSKKYAKLFAYGGIFIFTATITQGAIKKTWKNKFTNNLDGLFLV